MSLTNLFARFMHNGVLRSTPAHLVDRIVFSNWVCLIGTGINFLGAQANLKNGYTPLLSINVYYQIAFVLTWLLNRNQQYLSARLIFLFAIYSGITFSCAIQGPAFQMEYYLLPFAALAMSLFHPTERYWAWLFVGVSFVGFHFFVTQSGPVLDIDPARGLYKLEDLRINQINYSLLLVFTLLGLSNAYFRAIKLVDEQRTRTFYQTRLSNLGLISCNVAHELNSPLAALNLQAYRLQSKLRSAFAAPDQLEETERILKLSERLSTVVQSFKLLSDQTENETVQQTTLLNLFKLSTDLTHERMKRYGIRLDLELHEPMGHIECQMTAMSQALFCLIDNSIEAIYENPGDRWIRIVSTTVDESYRFTIQDSGVPPAGNVGEKLFESFFTTKPLGRGIGMGLTIVRQTIEAHGGGVYLDSTVPNTTFVVTLPRKQSRT